MTENEIKFKAIELINGVKYMTTNQINDFKAYVRHHLNLEDAEENNKPIEEAVKIYFSQPV